MVRSSLANERRKRVANTLTAFFSISFCNSSEPTTDSDDQSCYHPDINWESKLQPSLSIGIHAIVETGLDSQVKVEPGYEDYQYISQARDMLSLEENSTVELPIYCSF